MQITEKLNENSYIFCGACENHLRNFSSFKNNCKESWKKLANHFTDEWAYELEQLLGGNNAIPEKQDVANLPDICLAPPEDEVFVVDSDSEASTLPIDPEDLDLEDLVEASAVKINENIGFIDVSDVSNDIEEPTNDDSVPSGVNGFNNVVKKIGVHRVCLFSLGLLPKPTIPYSHICNVCHLSTDDIKEHYITAHTTAEQNKFICSGCTNIHKTQEQIIKHIKSYHTLYLKPRKCDDCDDTFIESGEFHRHATGHQRTKPRFVCGTCGKMERNRSSLDSHVMRIHNGAQYCKFCYKVFADDQNNEYLSHMQMEEAKRAAKGLQIFVCDVCGYKTRYKQQLKCHVQNLHKIPKEKDLPCVVCEKKFSSSENLRHHMKYNHRKKYKCTDCDQLFGFLKDMRYHYQRDHTEDGLREACDICGKILSIKAMPLHKNTVHSNLKPFQCNVCDKAFKQKIMLKTHMYKHTGFRPYFCRICDRGFYDSPVLEKHFLREHGKKLTKEDIKRDCKRKASDHEQC